MEDSPWPYIVIDNFLQDYDFHLSEVNRRKSVGCGAKYRLSISDTSSFPDIFKYCEKLDHRPYNEVEKVDWYYSVQHGPYEYPIHHEWVKKIISVVVYLGDEGTGTDLYKPDKSYYGRIDWKPNRAFIFAGKENYTYHSYCAKKGETRKTLNGFIISK